jgi:hypothetical protein
VQRGLRRCAKRYNPHIGSGATRDEAIMAHLVDKHFLERANSVLLLGILWGGLAACAIGAMVYDIALWLQAW